MDKYDGAIAYLTSYPGQIFEAWNHPHHRAHCLFQYCTADGRPEFGLAACGCLTQVKDGGRPAATPQLTAAIRADARLPDDPNRIEVKDLPVFAEWQRKLDKEIRQIPGSIPLT